MFVNKTNDLESRLNKLETAKTEADLEAQVYSLGERLQSFEVCF